MLTDIIEAEFDIKEEEPWYDHQDLEHGELFFIWLSVKVQVNNTF